MEVITEVSNSLILPPCLLLALSLWQSTSSPFFLVFASGCLSQLSFSLLPQNIIPNHSASLLSKLHYTFKKFPFPRHFFLSLFIYLAIYPSVHPAIQPSRHVTLRLCVCLEGAQVFRHSLQPRLLDHYYSIISGDGGHAADA